MSGVVLISALALLPSLVLGNLHLREAPAAINYERFIVESVIVARYATTSITSVIRNTGTEAQLLNFQVQLPETAFISSFQMVVNGTVYNGVAQDKASAREEFEERVDSGENVGLVESRGTNVFQIHFNTAANDTATFMLGYEELIIRRATFYTQTINLNPGQKVEDLRATVRVIDEQALTMREGSNYLTKEEISAQETLYTYQPTLEEQDDDTFGLARDLEVKYDIEHPSSGAGLIIVNDCYFAQFFSPSEVPTIAVDIVLVIDVSGSMGGTKIDQTRQALVDIITKLRPEDRFTMVTFESEVFTWYNGLLEATNSNKFAGTQFAESLQAGGGTNFNGGLERGIAILKAASSPTNIPLVLMLTDGEPTAGITDSEQIRANARTQTENTRISINCLGFGFYLNFLLLQQLSIENRGTVRRIYEAEDAVSQLEGFFEEISSPIMHSVQIVFPPNTYEEISTLNFPLLFGGSELIVAGKFTEEFCVSHQDIEVVVTGVGKDGELSYSGTVNTGGMSSVAGFEPSTERLTAYLRIQQLLNERLVQESAEIRGQLENTSLALALQYNFVTELTSLLVVQDDGQVFNRTVPGGGGDQLSEDIFLAVGPGFNGRFGGCPGLHYTPAYLAATLVACLLFII